MIKTGYVGFVGLPNSGKSTLLNTLLGEKVCIVSSKPQATRRRVQGILTHGKYQIVIVDSPGFLSKPSTPLHEFIMNEAKDVLTTVDVIVILMPTDLDDEEAFKELVLQVQNSKKKYIYCITKSDLKPTESARKVIESLRASPQIILKVSEKEERAELSENILEAIDPF
ncbi:MAG: 50S ribosome-binding GTPase, partial [Bdellovibrionaceae bacterium]|nr:50S ribosome-binding GTPase [Pseudobdellovibrionaceae bacterium]